MGIVFDFDGVLVNSAERNVAVLNAIAPKYGYDQLTMEDYIRISQYNFYQYWQMLLGSRSKDFLLDVSLQPPPQVELILGMAEIVEKYRPVIVSSNYGNLIRSVLEKNNIHASEIYGGETEGSKVVKLRRIKREPNIFVTDTVGDVIEGHIAGYTVIAVTWGFNTEEMLQKARPQIIVNTPQELDEHLAHYTSE